MPTLAEIFLGCLPAGTAGPPALDGSLQTLWERGQAAWPDVALAAPDFARHLAAHLPAEAEVAGFLASVHASDLYLACACAQGAPLALAAFDRSILGQVPMFLARMDGSPSFTDEIRQILREKLLVPPVDGPPKIADYGGSGPLWSWVRVVAIRTAVSLRRNRDEQPAADLDEHVAKALPVGQDVEMDYIRSRYQNEFRAALRAAFASLPAEQRHVLRLHFAGGLTGDAIASVLQVTRRTVMRWLASARTGMFHEARRQLQSQLRLSTDELDSLVQMVRSSFDLSVSALLKSAEAPP